MGAPQGLAGLTAVARDVPDRVEQRREQRLPHLVADGGGQIGHLRRIRLEPPVVLAGELVGAEGRKPQVAHRITTLICVEVGEMARRKSALGCIEDQGQ